MNQQLSIAYVTRTLPAYRHSIMDRLTERGVRLSVIVAGSSRDPVATAPPEATSRWKLLVRRRRAPGWRADVLRTLQSLNPDVILLEHGAKLDFTWTILFDRGHQARRILWTHGIERRDRFSGKTSLAGRARNLQLRLADGVLCYDEDTARQLRTRLAGRRIGFARNTIDRSGFVGERQRLELVGRAAHRKSLGLPHRPYALGLGRLIPEKEFHRLAPIARLVRENGIDLGILFVGSGPERDRIRGLCEAAGLQLGVDFFMPGEITQPTRLMEWLYAADICINPGYLGLSVVDCAFGGVPIVSGRPGRKGPFHSPEWKYVEEGLTGWLVEPNTDEALAGSVVRFLARPEQERRACEDICVSRAQATLGVDVMIDGIVQLCESVHADGRR